MCFPRKKGRIWDLTTGQAGFLRDYVKDYGCLKIYSKSTAKSLFKGEFHKFFNLYKIDFNEQYVLN